MKGLLFWICLLAFAAWAAVALWVHFPEQLPLALGGFGLASLAVAALRIWATPAPSWLALMLLFLGVMAWYLPMPPRQDRAWAPDVAHIVKGDIQGDQILLENIRVFRWQDAHTAQEAWTSRKIDLNRLVGADMVTSVWSNPKIAHLLVSFRFQDEAPLTFSIEIRRELGEEFSAIGGFFRQFELSLIAADEADILHLRAVARGEEVRLYPLDVSNAQLREVFLAFVALGNDLNVAPRWYNTLTANCASAVWNLVRVLIPGLPIDISLVLPGLLPEYLNKFDALAGEGSLAAKRERALISPRAREMPEGADFSQWIRASETTLP